MVRKSWFKTSIMLICLALILGVGWTASETHNNKPDQTWLDEVIALRNQMIENQVSARIATQHWQQVNERFPIEANWIAEDFQGNFATLLLANENSAIFQLETMLSNYIQRQSGIQTAISASASSAETRSANNVANNVLDSLTSTLWHTKWDLSDPLPQSITLSLQSPEKINQITYLPRQDGNSNGIITEYRILSSNNGQDFVEIQRGFWSLNSQAKTVSFPPVSATHIRLEAIQGFGGWASAAELTLGIDQSKLIPLQPQQRTFEGLLSYYHKLKTNSRNEALQVVAERDFEDILFIKRERLPNIESLGNHMVDQYFGHNQIPGGGLYILKDAFSKNPSLINVLENSRVANGPRTGEKLEGGTFLSPDLSYCGTKIVFAYTDAKRDNFIWDEENVFHIFSVNLDGSDLIQLTFGPYNDFDPIWIPGGDIIFISERRGGFGRCHQRPVPTYTLHRMSADGSNIRIISYHETNEWNPAVDNHGMIIYTRWDYVDRGATHMHSAWITNPAGEDPRALTLNYPIPRLNLSDVSHLRDIPLMQMSLRPIPNSNKIIATAAPHHGQNYGTLIIIDPDIEDDDHTSTIVNITPSTGGYPESGRGSTNYATPYPLSEEQFLTAYSPDSGMSTKYGIYLLNIAAGQEERLLLYLDPTISAQDPIPIKARPVPNTIRIPDWPAAQEEWNVVAHPGTQSNQQSNPDQSGSLLHSEAEVFVANVYDSLIPFPAETTIKELRIWQVYPKTSALADVPMVSYESKQSRWSGRNTRGLLGTVPVESDGSVYFKLPTGIPVFFQAVDENGLAVQSMRSVTHVIPGQEFLSCQGCHEPRHSTPVNPQETPEALRRPASSIAPETALGARPMSFPLLIQPILDESCISCHNSQDQKPDLRGIVSSNGWYRSYINLEAYVFLFDTHYRGNWDQSYPRTEPGGFGARQSELYQRLISGHGNLSKEDLHRFVIWMDSHVLPFYGDYNQAVDQRNRILIEPILY